MDTTIDIIECNNKFNEMKAKYPDSVTLIEAIQNAFNKNVQIISPSTRQALLQFPMQFIQRIPVKNGEWTTKLHHWANNKLVDLLKIDPIILTTKNSKDETVLHTLVHAALGRFTKTVDHDFIEKILKTDMNYSEITVPGDEESAVPGNAWLETDLEGNTPMDYLYDRANSDNEYEGMEPDDKLLQLIDKYAEFALTMNDEMKLPSIDKIDEEQAQEDVEESIAENNESLDTQPVSNTIGGSGPNDVDDIDTQEQEQLDSQMGISVNDEGNVEVDEAKQKEESSDNIDAQSALNLIDTILKLGRSVG